MAAVAGSVSRNIATSARLLANHGTSATAGHEGGMKLWRNLSFLVAVPGVGLCMVNAYLKEKQTCHDPPPFIPYEHLRLRSKRFPWGDGNHSLFHNSHVNALPDGYEEHEHH